MSYTQVFRVFQVVRSVLEPDAARNTKKSTRRSCNGSESTRKTRENNTIFRRVSRAEIAPWKPLQDRRVDFLTFNLRRKIIKKH